MMEVVWHQDKAFTAGIRHKAFVGQWEMRVYDDGGWYLYRELIRIIRGQEATSDLAKARVLAVHEALTRQL